MRFSEETKLLIKGETLNLSSVKSWRDIFPMKGEAWERIRLVFSHDIAGTTYANPVALGGYQFLKNLTLKTSRNEIPYSNPGMGQYYLNLFLRGSKPSHDVIAAADATYIAVVDIPFSFDFLYYQDDLLLQTKNYSHVELELALGGLADMFGTVGDATLTSKLDMVLVRSKNPFIKEQEEKAAKTRALIHVRKLAPFNPTTQPYILLESADDLALFGFLLVAHEDATPGVSYSGTPADIIGRLTFKDNVMPFIEGATLGYFREERQKKMGNSGATLTGIYPYLFAQDGSLYSAYGAADKSEIRIDIDEIIGSPSNPQVDVLLFGMRTLR